MTTSVLKDIETLVVRFPTWVGDIVMATPVFDCLRTNFPKAKIVGVTHPKAQGIVTGGPWFDGFVDASDKTLAGFRHMRRQLRTWRPDAGILLSNSFRSALTMRLSGVPKVYGYRRQGRDFLLAGGPTPQRDGQTIVPIPMVEYYLEICRWMGLQCSADARLRLFISPDLQRRGEQLLAKYGIAGNEFLIGLNPGASFGASKCWPADHFAELAELCQERFDAKIIIFSGPGEEEIVETIVSLTGADVIDIRPDKVDLEMLKPLVARCNLMITNDTGPRHYAVAFDVPVVVIMGSTDPRYTDSNTERTIVVRRELPCSPCHLKTCPGDHACMKLIEPPEVLAAAEKLCKVRA